MRSHQEMAELIRAKLSPAEVNELCEMMDGDSLNELLYQLNAINAKVHPELYDWYDGLRGPAPVLTYPDLAVGTVVRATVKIPDPDLIRDVAAPGMLGTVVQEADAVNNTGPSVCWLSGARCNVYEGEVEVVGVGCSEGL